MQSKNTIFCLKINHEIYRTYFPEGPSSLFSEASPFPSDFILLMDELLISIFMVNKRQEKWMLKILQLINNK